MRGLLSANKWIYAVIILIVIAVAVPAAMAFLTARDSAVNEFTAGENTSHIEEAFASYGSFKAGQSYEKNVAVKNDGSVPCYVRVFAELEKPDTADNLTIDFNTDKWTEKQPDGYYYYKDQLAVGDVTEPLFTTLTAKEDIEVFSMICYSETIQAAGSDSCIKAFYR